MIGSPMKSKTEIAKTVVGFVVGAGASRIVRTIIAQNHSDEEHIHNKVAVESASIVAGMMVAEKCKKYTDNAIDEAVNWYETNVKPRL